MMPWMLRNARLMLFIYLTDMLMPFLLISTYTNWFLGFVARASGYDFETLPFSVNIFLLCVLIYVGSAISFTVRNIRLLRIVRLRNILFFPFLILFLSVFMLPIRMTGLAKCADSLSWGTRKTTASDAENIQEDIPGKMNGYQILMRLLVVFLMLFFVSFSFFMELFF